MNQTAKTGQESGKQMRITDNERALIKSVFKGHPELVKLLRKIFLPEIDPKAPIGQLIDLWMTVDVKDMTPDMALINIKARNALITHVDQQLFTLEVIANMEELTDEQVKEKVGKNSSK